MWTLKRSLADKLFSDYIRERDKWTCQRCFSKYQPPTSGLHCSHFHGRGKKSVRWDIENAAAMCWGCHQYLGSHPLDHVELFKKRLGENRFDLLTLRANMPKKVDQKLVVLEMKDRLKDLRLGLDV